MKRVFLDFVQYGAPPGSHPTGGWVVLRDLCGEDEEAIDATDTEQAIALLDRLLVTTKGAALGPGQARTLTASDRDRLLATIFRAEFGTRIDCTLRCESCGEPFDIDFQLPDLMASLGASSGELPDVLSSNKPDRGDGVVQLEDGRRLRLPRGDDELAVHGLPPEAARAELLARCLLEGEADPDDSTLLEALERTAPIIDADLVATCPECGAGGLAHFDLQHYLLTAIAQEAPARIAEIHLLAKTYGWSLAEILALRHSRRRAFAMAIERDRSVQTVDL
jgi:hypothetical protein